MIPLPPSAGAMYSPQQKQGLIEPEKTLRIGDEVSCIGWGRYHKRSKQSQHHEIYDILTHDHLPLDDLENRISAISNWAGSWTKTGSILWFCAT